MNTADFTIIADTDNAPGVLQRITIVFTRRKLNIESLTVSETEKPDISRFTIIVKCQREIAQKVARQIKRIVEVKDVILCEDSEICFRELALFKVRKCEGEERSRLETLVSQYLAEIVLENETGIMIENSGPETETQQLFAALKPFGVKEFVRSGRIALLKADRAPKEEQTAHADTATEAEALSWL